MRSRRAVRWGLQAAALAVILGFASGCTPDAQRVEQYVAEAAEEREAGNHREAMILLRQALGVEPKNAEINLKLAETLVALDRTADASFYFAEAYRLDPSLTGAALSRAPLLYDGDPEQARALVEEVLEREPDNHVAHVRRAELALVDVDTETALTAALTARELAPDEALPHRMLGTVYQAMMSEREQLGEEFDETLPEKALAAFDRARELAEDPAQDLIARARVYTAWPGREEEAREAWREAFEVASEEGSEAAMRRASQAALRYGLASRDRSFVRWALERRLEVDPDRVRAWRQLAQVAEQEEAGSGDEVWRQALEEQGDDPMLHAAYAAYLAGQGRGEEVARHLESLPDGVAQAAELDLLRVKVLVGEDRLEEARQAIAAMRERHADAPRALFAEAYLAWGEGRFGDASASLRSVSEELERADVFRLLAQVETARGEHRNALAAATRAIDVHPSPDRALYRMRHMRQVQVQDWEGLLRSLRQMRRAGLGWGPPERIQVVHAQYQLGRGERARALLDQLLEGDSPSPGAVRVFVRYEGRRQTERARELLERAMANAPERPALAATLAQLELATGRPQAALEGLARAGAPEELPPPLRLLRARALGALGRWEEAEKEARAAFGTQPRPPASAGILARTLQAQDRPDEAMAILEEARGRGDLSGRDLWLLGRMALQADDMPRAREVLEEAVAAEPTLYEARNDLAHVLAETGKDLDRALDLAQQARSALPRSAAVADTLGRVYYRRGLMEPAVSAFRSALDVAGEQEEALRADIQVHLALALRELGREEEALQVVEEALALRPDHTQAKEMRAQLAAADG